MYSKGAKVQRAPNQSILFLPLLCGVVCTEHAHWHFTPALIPCMLLQMQTQQLPTQLM